jgi:ATP-dependent RNA helicase DOB1
MKITSFNFPGCLHENIIPNEYPKECTYFLKLVNTDIKSAPAKTYPFQLDTFQKRAVLCLENSQSVLVAAHTSAGKTAVAQYAIAMALRDKQRVIYTSPIKALSNQKYRELQHEFNDVGLMTGDVTINESASCIVMTTEILRNMLYKGSEMTREMAWVIFDEVHYMRDKERGVVWEETMILLPNVVKYVFLSATIPNAREFAQWICKIKSQPCNVVYTDYRPVPLQHYVCVPGSEGIYLVVDEKGNFRDENFSKALSYLEDDLNLEKIANNKKKSRNHKGQESEIKKTITLIHENNLSPAICFSFSKKDCEANALSLAKLDLTEESEKELIENIYRSAISTLSEDDQQLPQIQLMLPMLKKGIGVHHGGLLPIVKEAVELIFQEGLIKVLFSTETFSMGINMPAKTVVFTSIEKWDGEEFRWLGGGEYIQMSGRAGRRGLDDKGVTILMLNKKMDPDVCKNILQGKADPLYSTFHLSYNMLVNLIRVEGMSPEYIIQRSFHQYQSERQVPQMKNKLNEIRKEIEQFNNKYGFTSNEDTIKNILDIRLQIEKYQTEISQIISKPEHSIPFMIKGRLVKVRDFGWGVCLNYIKKSIELVETKNKELIEKLNSENLTDVYFIDVLLFVKNTIDPNQKIIPGDLSKPEQNILGCVPVLLNSIEGLSQIKVYVPHDLKDKNNLKSVERLFLEILKRFNNKPVQLDPINDMKIDDPHFLEIMKKLSYLEETLKDLEKKESVSSEQVDLFKKKENFKVQANTLCDNLRKMKDLVLKDDLKNMNKVLKRLDFTTKDGTVTKKGQIACQISTSDEILLTEMLFNGAFNDIESHPLCAMLSCFLVSENTKSEKQPKNPILNELHNVIKKNAERVADVLTECRITVDKVN